MVATPELAPVRESLLRALPVFDSEAKKRHGGKTFNEVTPAEQDEILGTWQHGREGRPHLFDVLIALTLEGAFGDPKYGGNIGGRGYAMLGVRPDPPLSKMALMPAMHHTGD
jgi:Gluconate 2-dehydrogenase subunit 3